MKDHQAIPVASVLLQELEPTHPFETERAGRALQELREAYTKGKRLAVVRSGWSRGSNHLVEQFLNGLGKAHIVATAPASCSSDSDAMREFIRPIGIDPRKVDDRDLENVFVRFLDFQRKRNRHTIVILNETRDSGDWVRRRVRRLIELEARENYGLFVILRRRAEFAELAAEPRLEDAGIDTGEYIALTPFTAAETRSFIRWRIDAADTADMGRIFDFEAITLIHELCEGIPDGIEALTCAALELADQKDVVPVTTDIVVAASREIGLEDILEKSGIRPAATDVKSLDNIPTLKVPKPAVLVVACKGETINRLKLTKPRLSIGRSPENDIVINSPFVSRQHAAIIRDGLETAVIDLESRNGTRVNSKRVRARTLCNGDEVMIGFHSIRFEDPEAVSRVSLNGVVRTRARANGFSGSRRVSNGVAPPPSMHKSAGKIEP